MTVGTLFRMKESGRKPHLVKQGWYRWSKNFFPDFPWLFPQKRDLFPWPHQRKVYYFPWPKYILHFQIVCFWNNNWSCLQQVCKSALRLPWEVHTMQNPGSKSFWIWNYLGLEKTRCLWRPYHIHMLILHHLSLVPKKIFLQTNTSLSQKARK